MEDASTAGSWIAAVPRRRSSLFSRSSRVAQRSGRGFRSVARALLTGFWGRGLLFSVWTRCQSFLRCRRRRAWVFQEVRHGLAADGLHRL